MLSELIFACHHLYVHEGITSSQQNNCVRWSNKATNFVSLTPTSKDTPSVPLIHSCTAFSPPVNRRIRKELRIYSVWKCCCQFYKVEEPFFPFKTLEEIQQRDSINSPDFPVARCTSELHRSESLSQSSLKLVSDLWSRTNTRTKVYSPNQSIQVFRGGIPFS